MFICAVCLAYEPVAKILSDTRQKTSTPAKIELTAGTRLEIPAKLKNVPEQILQRKGYTVSYNKDLKIPNWVAWELTPENWWSVKAVQTSSCPTPTCLSTRQ